MAFPFFIRDRWAAVSRIRALEAMSSAHHGRGEKTRKMRMNYPEKCLTVSKRRAFQIGKLLGMRWGARIQENDLSRQELDGPTPRR
jgi:hypothetical protein